MIYAVSIIATMFFVIYSKWQFSDDKGETSGKWHGWGLAMRASTFVGAFIMQMFPSSWQDYLLAGALCCVAWEIGINVIALAVKWYYVGSTSKMDIKFRKYHWLIYFGFLSIGILIRIFIK